jgi:hypothetical protein
MAAAAVKKIYRPRSCECDHIFYITKYALEDTPSDKTMQYILIAVVFKTTTAINICFNRSDPEIFSALKLSLQTSG